MQFRNRQITLVRHAPVTPSDRLFGRTDADIMPLPEEDIDRLSRSLKACDAVYTSPAIRCVKTCKAVLPNVPAPQPVDAFWEQNFGSWEAMLYADIPDIGHLQGNELTSFRPPQGESFSDLCSRTIPALQAIIKNTDSQHIALFAHAGVIRSFLSCALESQPAALKFEIDTLSMTCLRILPDGQLTVIASNITS